mmetsp:Transcript_14760/g.18515  ORF Transcript_14760/g.18515 Transcript_14760/m.18515 type:complete len:119 (+) Transcript_14760:954-1310(+)
MKTLREGIRLPMLDCDALERAAKKRTGSRLDSGATSMQTQMQTPNMNDRRFTGGGGAINDPTANISSIGSQRGAELSHFASAEGVRKRPGNKLRGDFSILEQRLKARGIAYDDLFGWG